MPFMAMNKNSKQYGFTLVELMVTVAILAILVGIALPNMSEFLNTRRVVNRADQAANLLRFARSEAIRLNVPVVVCDSNIKSDGKADNFCRGVAVTNERGLSAFAIRGALPYDANRDTLLRSVVINQGSKNVDIVLNHITFAGTANVANTNILVFYPNGTFGRMNNNNGLVNGAAIGDGLVRMQFRDDLADEEEVKNRRSRTLLVDAGGRVSVCPKNDGPVACTAN